MKRAIFLDRDGVINKLVYNPKTKEYGAPLDKKNLAFYPSAIPALRKFKKMDFLLFLISNQPDYAKGKTGLKNLKAVHHRFHRFLEKHGIKFTKYYYCYHHPEGIVKGYAHRCPCRKPNPYFLLKAKEKYGLDMKNSWLIGDRDADIFCGQAAGVRTIQIKEKYSRQKRGKSRPGFYAGNLKGALKIISDFKKKEEENAIA